MISRRHRKSRDELRHAQNRQWHVPFPHWIIISVRLLLFRLQYYFRWKSQCKKCRKFCDTLCHHRFDCVSDFCVFSDSFFLLYFIFSLQLRLDSCFHHFVIRDAVLFSLISLELLSFAMCASLFHCLWLQSVVVLLFEAAIRTTDTLNSSFWNFWCYFLSSFFFAVVVNVFTSFCFIASPSNVDSILSIRQANNRN